MNYDLLIKNGNIIDPSQNINKVSDLAIKDGKIADIQDVIDYKLAKEVIDAKGKIVSPGLIDLHVHSFWGGSIYGIDPDLTLISKGVTTALDAGSTGSVNFPAFRNHVIDKSKTSIYALLNVSSIGMISNNYGEIENMKWFDYDSTIEVAEDNRDLIIGIKARLGRVQAGENDIEALKRAIELAEAINGILMIHIGNSPTPLPKLIQMLREGDIVTHSFHGIGDGILENSGKVVESMKEAQSKGIIIDVGHGAGGFSFKSADKAMSNGLLPSNISSDLHIGNIEGPVFDLLTTLTKFMYLGMSLYDVVNLCTNKTAQIMAKDKIGTLKVGSIADITIFHEEEGKFKLYDRTSYSYMNPANKIGPSDWALPQVVISDKRLSHSYTIKNGVVYSPWLK